MDNRRSHTIKKKAFALFGLVVPLYTLTFSYKGPFSSLTIVTFSQIGARYGAIDQLIIWGIMSSVYYFLFLSYLFDLSGNGGRGITLLLGINFLTLLVTVFLPFAPSMFPFMAKAHNFLAYITAASTVFSLLIYVIKLKNTDLYLFLISLTVFIAAISVVVTVLLVFGVSSLFQIVLSTVMCLLMFVFMIFLEKSKKIDIYENLENKLNSLEKSVIFE